SSFEEFFSSTKDQLFQAILVVARDRGTAEDAVSEAYTRALENWKTVQGHPAPSAWVAKTAFNYLRSGQRHAARAAIGEVPDVPVSDDPPTDPQLLFRLLSLPERQREIVALRFVLGLSTQYTAYLLRIAPSTVSSQLFRVL